MKSLNIFLGSLGIGKGSKAGPRPAPKAKPGDASVPPPWPLFILRNVACDTLKSRGRALTPAPIQVLEDMQGFMRSQMLLAAVQLRLADVIRDRSLTLEEVAKEAGVTGPADNLHRLLRCLERFGYFAESEGLWSNSRLSSALRADHPNCMAAMVGHWGDDSYASWAHLTDAVKSDTWAFPRAYGGKDFWQLMAEEPARSTRFNAAMTAVDHISWYGQVYDYPWGRFDRVIDVGGSLGSLLARILEAYTPVEDSSSSSTPSMHGVLFDLPGVCEEARRVWAEDHKALLPRVTIQAGDFLQPGSLPTAQDGDAYLLRNILHDWDDAQALRILTNIRQAMGTAKATLVLVETAPEASKDRAGLPRYSMDLHMLVTFRSKERSRAQWEGMFHAAGFKLNRIVPTRGLFQVVEASPTDAPPAGSTGVTVKSAAVPIELQQGQQLQVTQPPGLAAKMGGSGPALHTRQPSQPYSTGPAGIAGGVALPGLATPLVPAAGAQGVLSYNGSPEGAQQAVPQGGWPQPGRSPSQGHMVRTSGVPIVPPSLPPIPSPGVAQGPVVQGSPAHGYGMNGPTPMVVMPTGQPTGQPTGEQGQAVPAVIMTLAGAGPGAMPYVAPADVTAAGQPPVQAPAMVKQDGAHAQGQYAPVQANVGQYQY